MRITNNMILHNTTRNINGNKVNVDALNNQMTSQKKIQRPSENPVIAIRALRLRSTLSEIDQYYETNIPDAESWLDITDKTISNIISVISDVRTQCTAGANDPLKAEDRNTILTQLEKLSTQIYSEGNAEYAGRTIFTGYRTNQTLTFMEDDRETSYDITQKFSYADLQEHRYYSDKITMPNTSADVLNTAAISKPKEGTFERIRLDYDKIDYLVAQDAPGATGQPVNLDGTANTSGYMKYTYMDTSVNPPQPAEDYMQVTVYETLEDWAAAGTNNEYEIDETGGPGAVFIRETGELVLGKDAASGLKDNKANLELNYSKTGFDKGEVRPEFYFNCTNKTVAGQPIDYVKFDADGKEIYQDINYVVATGGQTLTVNTHASKVLDASLGRDVDEMIEAVRFAIEANDKVAKLEEMQKMEQYSDDYSQAALESWLTAAKKERDYADDNMQKLYNSYIENCDGYLEMANLAHTDVGAKGVSLALTKNRMENQQTTVETLKSTNEDRELSDIIIDYTAAYTAYEASLQAAAKVNQNSLLNYI